MKKYDLITPIVLILSGLLLLFIPGGIINTVISIFGIIIIALGILSIIESVKDKQNNIGIAYGILISILGIIFISNPSVIAGIIPLILGIWILIKSAIRLQYVFFLKDSGSEEWIKAMIVNILTLILVLGIPVILNVSWLLILSGVSDGSSPFAVPSKNLKNFLHNPFVFFKYFIYSLESHGYKIITEMLNNDLLMMHLVINNTLVPIVTICTLIYLLFEKSEKKLVFSKGDKVFMILLTISLVSLIYLSDYIFWDNYNTKYIYGVYGRYFIPILPVICYLISEKIKIKVNMKNSRVLLLISCLMINFMTLMEIFIKFI